MMAFNGRFVMNIAQFAANIGGNMRELISLSGKSEQELCEETCQLDNLTYNAVIEQAVHTSGDPFFGLHAGENLNLSAAGLIGQLTQTSETVKQALELCCEFANLGCSALPMKLIEEKEYYNVTLTPDELWLSQSQQAVQHTAEGVIAFTIKEFHSLTRMQHNPLCIYLPWARPENISEYERVYGCPTHFNKNEIAILINKEHVEDKVITADYSLLRILIAHAEEKTSLLNRELGFASLVKQSVLKLVKPEFPTIDQVSAHLNISSRTLQRRLKDGGVTYKLLIDELRKDFAISYLQNHELTISEIAFLLGYADNSAFTRSFKRWTGKTPHEYRSQN